MMFARELRLRYDEEKPAEIKAAVHLLSKDDFIMLPEIKIKPWGPRPTMTGWSTQNLSRSQSCPAHHCN
jgi:hypothetical protein